MKGKSMRLGQLREAARAFEAGKHRRYDELVAEYMAHQFDPDGRDAQASRPTGA